MNKYEERADRDRKSTLRSSLFYGMAGIALVVFFLVFLGASSSAPGFWQKAAIAVAVVLSILRQMQRQLARKGRTKKSRAAEPDPQSRLNLDR